MSHTPLLSALPDASLAKLALLRLDLAGGPAPGNKSFKLAGYLARAREEGVQRLVSFGGAWSNHLHALAGVGYREGIETVGIVRGGTDEPLTPMLEDARRWGMRIVRVSRQEYRQRNAPAYQTRWMNEFAPCLVVPEGGASAEGIAGCGAIADMIRQYAPDVRRIVLPVGTGTTLAGLAAHLDERYQLVGISALRGAVDLGQRVNSLLKETGKGGAAHWRIDHEHHCGGFARVSPELRDYILHFEREHKIALEPVYTGKMLFAIHQMIQRAAWDPELPTLALHTGGLQGRRGFDWLAQ